MATAPYQIEGLARLQAILRAKDERQTRARVISAKVGPTCSRCGGCGEYSFNGTHSRCYGCDGSGYMWPKNAKQMRETIERAEAFDVDAYLDGLRKRAACRKVGDEVHAAWASTQVAHEYSRPWNDPLTHPIAEAIGASMGKREWTPELREAFRLYEANHAMCEATQRVRDAANSVVYAKNIHGITPEQVDEVLRIRDEALQIIRDAEAAYFAKA